jgi:hypothetical protein
MKRRCRAAGLPGDLCNHSLHATGITLHQDAGGDLEAARQIAGHASIKPRNSTTAPATVNAGTRWTGCNCEGLMKPFFIRLRGYWENVGKALRGESDAASIFPNATDVGTARERLYVEFLKAHVPAFCTVNLGGFAFGRDGSESKQIDVLVASGSAPRFDFLNRDGKGKSFASVDGLIAAVSLKSSLDGKEITDAVHNLASLPPVQDLGSRYHPLAPPLKDYEAWPLKVIYAPKGVAVETATEHLLAATADIPTTRWPDLIHVCGQYVIVKLGSEGGRTNDGVELAPNTFFSQITHQDVWGLGLVAQRIQEIEQSMRMMLFSHGALDNIPI